MTGNFIFVIILIYIRLNKYIPHPPPLRECYITPLFDVCGRVCLVNSRSRNQRALDLTPTSYLTPDPWRYIRNQEIYQEPEDISGTRRCNKNQGIYQKPGDISGTRRYIRNQEIYQEPGDISGTRRYIRN